jgi:hypothetical protein
VGATTWQAKMRKGIDRMVPEVLVTVEAQAKAGDTAAARLLLERALPPYKPTDPPSALALPIWLAPPRAFWRPWRAGARRQIKPLPWLPFWRL